MRAKSRLVVNQAVLAERNPGAVAPVGAWIEPGGTSKDLVSAEEVEKQLILYQKEKQQQLIHFQGEVKRRLNQHAKQWKQQQLQKSYDVLARESHIVMQSSDSAMHITPKRNTCTYRSSDIAIGTPHVHYVSTRVVCDNKGFPKEEDENGKQLFKEHSKTLKETMRQIRNRLAALRTVDSEELTLPGGLWRVSPTRDNPVSRRSPDRCLPHAEEQLSLLKGNRDLPFQLLSPMTDQQKNSKITLQNHRQNQHLVYKRLFMDIEREQVKETRRQKQHKRKISKIKKERETERHIEEGRLHRLAHTAGDRQPIELEMLKKQQINPELQERQQKTKDYNRFVEAVRAQMKDKMLIYNVQLAPLCCCGSDFWDSHPDTCANNCIFYKNPKTYTRALQSVLSTRDMWDRDASFKFPSGNVSIGRP